MAEMLLKRGAKFTDQDLTTQTLSGYSRMIKAFLDAGANVENKSHWGSPLLVLAAKSQNLDAIKVLLDRGADANPTGEYGLTPLTVSIGNEKSRVYQVLPFSRCRNNR